MSNNYEEIIVTKRDRNNNLVDHKAYEYNDDLLHIIYYPFGSSVKVDINGFTYEELLADEFFKEEGYTQSGIFAGIVYRINKRHQQFKICRNEPTCVYESVFTLNYQDLVDYSKQYRLHNKLAQNKNTHLINVLMGLPSTNISIIKRELLGALNIDVQQAKFSQAEISQLADFIKDLQESYPELIQGQIHHGIVTKLQKTITKFEEKLTLAFSDNTNKWSEKKWQDFLQENVWILNPSLKYVKGEQVLGSIPIKRTDLWGISQKGTTIIYEFKKPNESMLSYDDSHKNFYWHTNTMKAISQADRYYYEIIKRSQSISADMSENPSEEYGIDISKINLTAPKVYLIVGHNEFLIPDQNTVNPQKKKLLTSEFQRLRRSLKNIEIVTFDELLDQLKGLKEYLES